MPTRRALLGLTIAALSVSIAGCRQKAKTPAEAYKRLAAAVNAGDGGALFDALDQEAQDPLLLGGEQHVPHGIERLQCAAELVGVDHRRGEGLLSGLDLTDPPIERNDPFPGRREHLEQCVRGRARCGGDRGDQSLDLAS